MSMNNNDESIISKLKKPNSVDIESMRSYEKGLPTVTGLLSLIDSYVPDMEEALVRGTNVHLFIENMILWKDSTLDEYSSYKRGVFHFLDSLKNTGKKWEQVLVEKKLIIDGVFGWTVDWIQLTQSFAIVKDFKTAKVIPSYNSELFYKYCLQLKMYAQLVTRTYKVPVVENSLLFLTPEYSTIRTAKDDVRVMNDMNILILYYHAINWTHTNHEVISYFLSHSLTSILLIPEPSKNKIGWKLIKKATQEMINIIQNKKVTKS